MQKTLDIRLKAEEAQRIAAAVEKYDEALRSIFKQMRKDQAQIKKLQAETRVMLAEMKNA